MINCLNYLRVLVCLHDNVNEVLVHFCEYLKYVRGNFITTLRHYDRW